MRNYLGEDSAESSCAADRGHRAHTGHAVTERIQCSVPFCERTTAANQQFTQWVCSEHWKGLPRQRRLAYNRAKKRWQATREEKDQIAADMLWKRLQQAAINRALGLKEGT